MRATRIAIKYCGGCNPDYDREAAVAAMLTRLGRSVEVVASDDIGAEVVVAVQGCRVACAGLDAFHDKTVVILSSREDVERFTVESPAACGAGCMLISDENASK